jgi:hypothetical protein
LNPERAVATTHDETDFLKKAMLNNSLWEKLLSFR